MHAAGWPLPERFVAKGRDGTTDIYGVIYRPRELRPVEAVPGDREHLRRAAGLVRAQGFPAGLPRSRRWPSCGFIVVQIDGMGTSQRSKAFHDVCWKNLADAGFPDRILWIKAAAAKYPYMDLSAASASTAARPAGRTRSAALLLHGDFYKVGVADCGCHDNRMDKIWWNEQWMGWPVGPEYAAAIERHATPTSCRASCC